MAMFTFSYDPLTASLVGLYGGAPNTDRDYARALGAFETLYREAGSRIAAAALVIEPGMSPPSAKWRARFADLNAIQSRFCLAIVTESAIVRGIITAVHWIKPPSAGQKVVSLARFDAAVPWLETECGRPLAGMYRMTAQLRLPAAAPMAEARG